MWEIWIQKYGLEQQGCYVDWSEHGIPRQQDLNMLEGVESMVISVIAL